MDVDLTNRVSLPMEKSNSVVKLTSAHREIHVISLKQVATTRVICGRFLPEEKRARSSDALSLIHSNLLRSL